MSERAIDDHPRPRRGRLLALALTAMAVGVGIGYLANLQRISIEDIKATVIEPARDLEAFQLTTHSGAPFTLASLKGKWSFLFFGYTYCPDVCPTTLNTLAQVEHQISEIGDDLDIQVVFVTVDPERDTAARLSEYVPYFDPTFIGVTGTQADINRLTRQLGILHLRVERDGVDGYLVDHTASVLLFNPDGELRAVFPAPHVAQDMVADLINLVRL